jgi:hypothetical protein
VRVENESNPATTNLIMDTKKLTDCAPIGFCKALMLLYYPSTNSHTYIDLLSTFNLGISFWARHKLPQLTRVSPNSDAWLVLRDHSDC